jgi:hypothetical protein
MHARTASRPRGARIAAFGATALLASASLLVTSVSLVRASTAPYAHGSITGEVGCAQQLHPGGCPSMNEESPAGNPDWSFDRTIALTEGGNAESAKATLGFHEVDDAKGFLGGLTMTGEMHIDVTPAGHASARGVFSADFATLAPTLSLVGSATVDSKGTDSIGSSAAVHVQLDCGAVDESVTSTAGFDIPTGHQVV